MFYRLPIFFSACFYGCLLLISTLYLVLNYSNGSNIDGLISAIFAEAIYSLTTLFFMIVLSCLFFYHNKIYYCSQRNRRSGFFLASIIAVIFFIIKWALSNFFLISLLPKVVNQLHYNIIYDSSPDMVMEELMLSPMLLVMAYLWSLILLAIIFNLMIKVMSRHFLFVDWLHFEMENSSYHTELFNAQASNLDQLTTEMSSTPYIENSYRLLYATIFSSIFCGVANGTLWNVNFSTFSLYPQVYEVFNQYSPIFYLLAVLFIGLNYFYLFWLVPKWITKVYHRLPTSSLLTAAAITLVLFGIIILLLNMLSLVVILSLDAIIIGSVCLFLSNYVVLYFLSGFALKRYFA